MATAYLGTGVSGLGLGIYGDGSDGNVNISGTTTLARDMYYDTLTIGAAGILKTANFRVMCKTLLTIASGGIVSNDGNSAAASVAGTATASGTLAATLAGVAGGTGVGGNSAASSSNFLGGKGGNGGAGTPNAGGTAGNIFGAPTSTGQIRMLPQAALGLSIGAGASLAVGGGNSGAAGGGDGVNTAGASGAGAGLLLVNARQVNNQGTMRAKGGDGGTPAAGNTGGGGPGGGGTVIINSAVPLVGNAPTAAAGTPGSGHGTGTAGAAGNAGTVITNVWT